MDVLIAILATWRITHMMLHEKGPFHVFTHLNTWLGSVKGLSDLTTCHWCLSVWVGTAVALLYLTPYWVVLTPFALSAVSIAIQMGVDRVRG